MAGSPTLDASEGVGESRELSDAPALSSLAPTGVKPLARGAAEVEEWQRANQGESAHLPAGR